MLHTAARVSVLSDVVRHNGSWLLLGVPAWHAALPSCLVLQGGCVQPAAFSTNALPDAELGYSVPGWASPGYIGAPLCSLLFHCPHPKPSTLPGMFCHLACFMMPHGCEPARQSDLLPKTCQELRAENGKQYGERELRRRESYQMGNRNFGCWTLLNLSSISALGNRKIQPSFCCVLQSTILRRKWKSNKVSSPLWSLLYFELFTVFLGGKKNNIYLLSSSLWALRNKLKRFALFFFSLSFTGFLTQPWIFCPWIILLIPMKIVTAFPSVFREQVEWRQYQNTVNTLLLASFGWMESIRWIYQKYLSILQSAC